MDFFERMKKVLGQGFDTTKEALGTAAEKAKELGEKGVLKVEIAKLEREAGKKAALVGNHVFKLLVEEGQNTVSKNTSEIKNLLLEISDLKKRIEAKEEDLKKIG
ncbi:MAG TPA: hypothetical protein VMX75_05400 [Spirochaetia bacterium]|nr:hypothetical protein [Spirochaetia bacterium]